MLDLFMHYSRGASFISLVSYDVFLMDGQWFWFPLVSVSSVLVGWRSSWCDFAVELQWTVSRALSLSLVVCIDFNDSHYLCNSCRLFYSFSLFVSLPHSLQSNPPPPRPLFFLFFSVFCPVYFYISKFRFNLPLAWWTVMCIFKHILKLYRQ